MATAYTASSKIKKKLCRFCQDKDFTLNYKAPQHLSMFITERGKIIPSRITGNCAYHQRRLTSEVKRSRIMALLPFTTNHS
ncbi:MAG: 30S ribosomal protein S18 [Deltaproteobacteria bacterium]|nr:30S ribosomal protein S18 [Deltaproteobacteria bacterium]